MLVRAKTSKPRENTAATRLQSITRTQQHTAVLLPTPPRNDTLSTTAVPPGAGPQYATERRLGRLTGILNYIGSMGVGGLGINAHGWSICQTCMVLWTAPRSRAPRRVRCCGAARCVLERAAKIVDVITRSMQSVSRPRTLLLRTTIFGNRLHRHT